MVDISLELEVQEIPGHTDVYHTMHTHTVKKKEKLTTARM